MTTFWRSVCLDSY